MSIANYSDLLTAAANWSHRTDLTSRIPEFIVLAESKMNRRLRTMDMVSKDVAFSIASEYVAVPTSFGGVKTFYLNTSPKTDLEFMADEQITQTYPTSTGKPKKYCVQGSNFRFGPAPDGTYTATLVYYLKVPALTSTATTNWMITNHPDAYVYGVMAEMRVYAKDSEGAAGYFALMNQVIDEIRSGSNRDRAGGGALATRPDSPVY